MVTQTFNHNMAIIGRKYRAISQTELAKKLKISQPLLHKIETGISVPDNEIIVLISKVLNLPKEFFFRKGDIHPPNLYYRKRSRTSKKLLYKVEAEMNIHRLNIQLLLEAIDIEVDPFPTFDLEFEKSPSIIAKKIRHLWKVPRGPIKNLLNLLESKGVIIIMSDFETSDIDGRGMYTDSLQPLIYLNQNVSMDRIRFSASHELAHIIMHMHVGVSGERNTEDEANEFAAEFLMPEEDIKPQLQRGLKLEKLANLKRYWGTSMNALLKRAQDLNTVQPNRAKNLWIEMSRQGFRRQEPPELEPYREQPTLLKNMIEFYKEELEYTDEELASALTLPKKEMVEKYYTCDKPKLKISVNNVV